MRSVLSIVALVGVMIMLMGADSLYGRGGSSTPGLFGWTVSGATTSTVNSVEVHGQNGLWVDGGGIWASGIPIGQNFPNPPGGVAFLGSHKVSQAGLWLTQPGNLPLTPSNVTVVGNGTTVGLNAISGGVVALELAANFVFVCTNGFCRTRSDGPTGITDLQVTDPAINVTAAMLTDGGVVAVYARLSSMLLAPRTLDTCVAGIEGTQEVDVLSGAATGKRTKLCLCTSDGSSIYKWQNVATGTLGSTTTCGSE